MRLEKEVAVVTGGPGPSHRLSRFASRWKARRSIDYVGNPDEAKDTKKKIADAGGKSVSVAADVSKPNQVQNPVDTAVKAFGKLDIVMNNAGRKKPRL